MNRIVLQEVPFNAVLLYQDNAFKLLELQKEVAMKSAPIVWAKDNRCEIKVTTTIDNETGDGSIVWYAALTAIQQTEFALRF